MRDDDEKRPLPQLGSTPTAPPEKPDLKRRILESKQRILSGMKGKFTGEETSRWLTSIEENPASAEETISTGGLVDESQLSMPALLDMLFDHLQRYIFELNKVSNDPDMKIQCERPAGWQEKVEYLTKIRFMRGHLSMRVWSFVVWAEEWQAFGHFIPTDFLIGFNPGAAGEFPSYIKIARNPSRGDDIVWAIEGQILSTAEIPRLARRLITQLVKISAGEATTEEKFAFSSSENVAPPPVVLDRSYDSFLENQGDLHSEGGSSETRSQKLKRLMTAAAQQEEVERAKGVSFTRASIGIAERPNTESGVHRAPEPGRNGPSDGPAVNMPPAVGQTRAFAGFVSPGQTGLPASPGAMGAPPGSLNTIPPGSLNTNSPGSMPPGSMNTIPPGSMPPGSINTIPPGSGAMGAPPGAMGAPPGAMGTPPGAMGAPPGMGTPPGGMLTPPSGMGMPAGAMGAPPGAMGLPPGAPGGPPGMSGPPPGFGMPGTPPGLAPMPPAGAFQPAPSLPSFPSQAAPPSPPPQAPGVLQPPGGFGSPPGFGGDAPPGAGLGSAQPPGALMGMPPGLGTPPGAHSSEHIPAVSAPGAPPYGQSPELEGTGATLRPPASLFGAPPPERERINSALLPEESGMFPAVSSDIVEDKGKEKEPPSPWASLKLSSKQEPAATESQEAKKPALLDVTRKSYTNLAAVKPEEPQAPVAPPVPEPVPEAAPPPEDYSDSSQSEPEYAQPEYAEPEYAQPEYAQPEYAQSEYAEPEYSEPEYAEPEYVQPPEPPPPPAPAEPAAPRGGLAGLVRKAAQEAPPAPREELQAPAVQVNFELGAAPEPPPPPPAEPQAKRPTLQALLKPTLAAAPVSSDPGDISRLVDAAQNQAVGNLSGIIQELDRAMKTLQEAGVEAMQSGNFESVQLVMEHTKRLKATKDRLSQLLEEITSI